MWLPCAALRRCCPEYSAPVGTWIAVAFLVCGLILFIDDTQMARVYGLMASLVSIQYCEFALDRVWHKRQGLLGLLTPALTLLGGTAVALVHFALLIYVIGSQL
jgi:hypothetical protein